MSASGKMLLRHDNAVSLSCSPPSQLRQKRKMKLSESDMMILTVVRRTLRRRCLNLALKVKEKT